MRKIILSMVLVAGGCNKDEGARPDLSVPADLSFNHDLTGAFTCDAVKQDCGPGMKCTYPIDPNNMQSLAQTCVAVSGMQALEQTCTRAATADPGDDTCAPGFF